MKKIYILPGLVGLALLLQSGTKYSFVPPAGFTGATGSYCNTCHNSPLNAAGGSITVSGLPTTGYVPGQAYPFSITITHSAANRTRWGFSIAARDASGTAVGNFVSNNANAAVNSGTTASNQELSHYNSAVQTASNSVTYNNLVWTAPATPASGNPNVTFFYVGNAANGAGTSGDFIYSGSTTIALPIELKQFSATVRNNRSVALQWISSSESNSDYYEVEKSEDNQFFYSIAKVYAAGNSATERKYGHTDAVVTSYNKPVFYRLKLVDKDGKFKLSKVVSVRLTGQNTFVENVYPTLVNNGMLVTAEILSEKQQPLQIQLVDANGKLLKTYTEPLQNGSNTIGFRMPTDLPQQWVFARFIIGQVQQTIPLVVHRKL